MSDQPPKVKDVVRIEGGRGEFQGCYAVVTEVCKWGVKADVIGPATISGEYGPYTYPIRLPWEMFVVVGHDWKAAP